MVTITREDHWWSFSAWESVNWSGVIAGLVIVLVAQVLLTTLGMAIGLTALEPTQSDPGAAFGWGAAIWAMLVLAISLFIGGYVAGRFAPAGPRANGALSGTLVWGLTLLLGVYLVGSGVRAFSSGLFSALGQTTQMSPDARQQLEELAGRAGIDLDQAQQRAETTAGDIAADTRAATTPGTPEAARARAAADRAVDTTAAAAWMLLAGSLIGLAIAAWAGSIGHRAIQPSV